jgi:predicted HTH transcriptional regulator
MPELDSETIDFAAASESFATIRKLKRSDLETLRLLLPHQGRKVPSVGGVLLFGRNCLDHFPDAWIQAGRFDGTDKTRIADTTVIHGSLPQMIESAIEFVSKHSLNAYQIGSLRRDVTSNIPPLALREALINATVHADYSHVVHPSVCPSFDDRVEVENPGILPPGLTVDDMRRGVSKLRNR